MEETKCEKENCSCAKKSTDALMDMKFQLSDSKEKYVRLYSDFENFKKRSLKEKEDVKESVKISMISSILDIDNDLNLALNNIKDEPSREGVSLIISKLSKYLTSQGIESVQTDSYDPEIHEVVSIIKESDEKKIVDVISKGYSINGKIFRFPKVIIG